MAEAHAVQQEVLESTARELGEAFGGAVVRVDSDEADLFFRMHQTQFTLDGQAHYLRLMGVGKALYDNQTEPTRVSILAAQKEKLRATAEGVYVLRNADGKFFFAAPASRLGWEDPRPFLGLAEEDGWLLTGDDPKRGILRFARPVAEGESDWKPAVFADVPYFYGRPVTLAVGLYTAHLNAGLRDAVNTSGPYRFKMDEFSSDSFREAAGAVAEVARAHAEAYAAFLDALRRRLVLIEDARTMLRNAAAEGRLPRFQTAGTLKYLNVLERGGEVDTLAPKSVQNMRDLADALALYGREGAKGSAFSQARAEFALFRVFFEDYYSPEDGPRPALVDLKECIAQKE